MDKLKKFMRGPGWIILLGLAVIGVGYYAMHMLSGRSPINVMATLKKQGVITIGIRSDVPPLGYYAEDGSLAGFEVELATALGEKIMGRRGVVLVEVTPKTRGAYLDQEKCDVLIASVNRSDANVERYNMGEVYLDDDIMFLSTSNAEMDLSSEDTLIGVIGNSPTKSILEAHIEADENLHAQVVNVPSHPEALAMLDRMEIDFYCNERSILNNNLKSGYKVTGPIIGTLRYAVTNRLREKDLFEALEAAYAELKTDGTLKELYQKYNLTPPTNQRGNNI